MRPQLGAKRVYQVAGECRDFHSFLFSLDRLEGCESFIRPPLSPVATRADERVATAAIRSIINPWQSIQRNDLMLHESANFILHAARDRPFRCKYATDWKSVLMLLTFAGARVSELCSILWLIVL